MNKNTNAENQRRFVADKKKQGLRRLILWVRPEDVEPLKEISRQPHTIAKRRAKVRAEIERELCPAIKAKVAAQLERKTRRALLIQKRTQPAYIQRQATAHPQGCASRPAPLPLSETGSRRMDGSTTPLPPCGTSQTTQINGLP